MKFSTVRKCSLSQLPFDSSDSVGPGKTWWNSASEQRRNSFDLWELALVFLRAGLEVEAKPECSCAAHKHHRAPSSMMSHRQLNNSISAQTKARSWNTKHTLSWLKWVNAAFQPWHASKTVIKVPNLQIVPVSSRFRCTAVCLLESSRPLSYSLFFATQAPRVPTPPP